MRPLHFVVAVAAVTMVGFSGVHARGEASSHMQTVADSIIYMNDFEGGQGLWQVSDGLWSVGADATLPVSAARSGKVAGAILGGTLPGSGIDTYLSSPAILLPNVTGGKEIRLNFLHWYEFNDHVSGSVSVRIDSGGGRYGGWNMVSLYYEWPLNLGRWREASVILTAYAGKRIDLGFHLSGFTNAWGVPSGKGWRIDDVAIWLTNSTRYPLPVAWDFDQDWAKEPLGDRWLDPLGLFSLGTSTGVTSPSAPCLFGSYLGYASIPATPYTTRQISPRITIPTPQAGADIMLRFRYFLEVNDHAWAEVHAAVDSGSGKWGAWKLIPGAQYSTSTKWTRAPLYIPAEYYGKDIRLGYTLLTFTNAWGSPSGKGLYVDDVDLFQTTDVPGLPVPVAPRNDSVKTGLLPKFTWRLSAAAFTYRLQLSRTNDFASPLLDSADIEPTAFTLTKSMLDTTHQFFWRVQAVNANGVSGWSAVQRFWPGTFATSVEQMNDVPSSVTLHQNYPNPFNPSTTIRFTLPERMSVRLAVYNGLGQQVAILTDEIRSAGLHEVRFEGSQLASGVYWYRLQAGNLVETKKLLLMK